MIVTDESTFTGDFPNVKIDFGVITAAARGGQLDVIKWLHYEKDVAWQKDAARQAAKNGHVHVLEWLHNCARPPLMISLADDPGDAVHALVLGVERQARLRDQAEADR